MRRALAGLAVGILASGGATALAQSDLAQSDPAPSDPAPPDGSGAETHTVVTPGIRADEAGGTPEVVISTRRTTPGRAPPSAPPARPGRSTTRTTRRSTVSWEPVHCTVRSLAFPPTWTRVTAVASRTQYRICLRGGELVDPGARSSRVTAARPATRRARTAAVPPGVTAQQIVERLPLPAPGVVTAPGVDADHIVGAATWLSVADWTEVTQIATGPGVVVELRAVPVSATWSMGDGETVTCGGPGSVDPAASDHSCSHVFVEPSRDRPGGRYDNQVTVTYEVTSTGSDGVPHRLGQVTRTSAFSLRVVEIQAVIS